MSRIAGIVGAAPEQQERLLADLRAGLLPGAAWRSAVRRSGPAAMLWTGWRERDGTAGEGKIAVALDGLFYNRDELDAETGAAPADPADDAARLLALYRRRGFAGALERINGDFAAALFDQGTETLFLGRDRFGLKPLYFAETPDGFAFASRPRALLRLPGVKRDVNCRFAAVFAGSHYRYIDNRPEESPYAAIRQLPAATALERRGRTTKESRYWTIEEAPDFGDERELVERYRVLLLDAVRRRVAVVERPAFTLSGGLDSSSVLSCAVEATGRKQQAFSTVYQDPTYDERAEIEPFLGEKVAFWHPVAVDEFDLLDLVGKMVAAHDEPVATATWLAHFLLCGEVARHGHGALFGGLGGDELNAGEYEYFPLHFADLRRAGEMETLAHEIARWARHHDHPIHRKDAAVAAALMDRVTDRDFPGRIHPDRQRMTRYFPAVSREFFDLATFEPWSEHPFASWLKNRTWQDLVLETAPCCLRAEDRHAAAYGFDRIDPFFDHRLAELMFRVPGGMKIRDGVTKRLLREAMVGILPEATRIRVKKTGWNAPAHLWFAEGRNADSVSDLVASRAFRERGLYDVTEVERLLAEHRVIVASGEPRENHMMFLWQLVNAETWLAQAEAAG